MTALTLLGLGLDWALIRRLETDMYTPKNSCIFPQGLAYIQTQSFSFDLVASGYQKSVNKKAVK